MLMVLLLLLVNAEGVVYWPYTPGLLVKWVAVLGSLHWPVGGADLGVGGVSYVELLILYEVWTGERLTLEKAHPRYLRPWRPISVSAVPFGPGIDIWCSCRFIGAYHCRLRHIGWERCGHGLASRPRESTSEGFLDQLLLFQYPRKSSRELLDATLPLRYCSTWFACRAPTWSLPMPGHVAALVHAGVGSAAFMQVLVLRLMVRLRWVMRGFIGLVVLVLVGNEFD